MQRVAVLALDGVVAFDLATPCHVFTVAGGYETTVFAPRRGRVRTTSFPIHAEHGVEAAADADTIVVPGIADITAAAPPEVLLALRDAQARGARIVSICTGAFVLGQAGLLDGRRCTTHWRSAQELQRRFPETSVHAGVLYVDEGDLLTSAGVAAGIDLCLHIVRSDRGAATANRVARRMVVAPHRDGGQSQFIERPLPEAPARGLDSTRAWMLERLDAPLTVADMACHAGFSPRSFARRFRSETGTTPLQWLLERRVEEARRLLESTPLPVEHVASAAGFGTAASLREHFRRACATTPTAYRAAFSASGRAVTT